MKMRILKTALSGICLAGMLMALESANATPVTLNVGLTDGNAVGDIINGIQGNDGQAARDALMVNNLLTVPLGTSVFIPPVSGEQYQRTLNAFSPLPAATDTGSQIATTGDSAFNGNFLDLTLSGGFRYLVAAYDGPNGGVEVWDIAGFATGTVLELPRYAHPQNPGNPDTGPLVAGDKYQMTGWSLLNPTTTPDGGSTVALLGFALLGIGALRNKFSKN